ncbi:hypothetical protein [Burkholderia vietnamiensis]|uniref:hypothetical protein n=1 Tax=Burkholderia vietnamiensis TaxID=60552 RepID=UPI0012DB4A8D|nr:hypothetical protein [Burkholderia vietnamiensis]
MRSGGTQDVPWKRGRAWNKIKATAAEQRQLWRDIGLALLVGKRSNPSPKLYGQWIKANGFDDISAAARTDAIWLASTQQRLLNNAPAC